MEKLGLLLSKPALVIISGLMFTGVAFASSGAGSLLGNHTLNVSEAKVPDVSKIEEPAIPPDILGTSVQDQAQESNQQVSQYPTTDELPIVSPSTPPDQIPDLSNSDTFEFASTSTIEPILPPYPSPTLNFRALEDDNNDDEEEEKKESDIEDERREQINQVIRSTEEKDEDEHED